MNIYKTQENPAKNELISVEPDKISGLQYINKYINKYITAIYGSAYAHYFNVNRHRYIMSADEWEKKQNLLLPVGHYFVAKESAQGYLMYVVCESVEAIPGRLWGETEYVKKDIVHLGSIFGVELATLDESVLGVGENHFEWVVVENIEQYVNIEHVENTCIICENDHDGYFVQYEEGKMCWRCSTFPKYEPRDIKPTKEYLPNCENTIWDKIINGKYNEIMDNDDSENYDEMSSDELEEYVEKNNKTQRCKKTFSNNYKCTCGWHLEYDTRKNKQVNIKLSNSFRCDNPTTKIKEAVNRLNESTIYDEEELVWTRIANEVKEILDQLQNTQ